MQKSVLIIISHHIFSHRQYVISLERRKMVDSSSLLVVFPAESTRYRYMENDVLILPGVLESPWFGRVATKLHTDTASCIGWQDVRDLDICLHAERCADGVSSYCCQQDVRELNR